MKEAKVQSQKWSQDQEFLATSVRVDIVAKTGQSVRERKIRFKLWKEAAGLGELLSLVGLVLVSTEADSPEVTYISKEQCNIRYIK